MALTRKFLESLGLNGETVEAVIQAHVEVTDALKHERDESAARVQADFDSYRAQVEAEKLRAGKLTALRGALKEAGVLREDFAELLLKAVDLDAVDAADPAAAISELRERYGGCFATTQQQGTPALNPPTAGRQTLTREAIQGMSVEDINAQWDQVKLALGGN